MKRLSLFILAVLSSTMMFGQTLHYQADYSGCNNLYTKITGVFAVNGEQIYNGAGMEGQGGQNIEIGVFDQNEVCRFTRVPQWRAKSSQYIYQMSIRGTEGMVYHFKVYDHNTNMETDLVDDFGQVIEYVPNAQIGSTSNPFILNFTHTSSGYTKHIVGYSADYDEVENPNDHYYLIASPLAENITPSTITGMTEGTYDLYYFDQSGDGDGNEWITYKGAEFPMMSGVGYLYAHGTDIDLTFTGAAYEGVGTVVLSYNPDAYWKGWNLVGNPFAESAYADRSYYALQNGSELVATGANVAVGAMEGIFVVAEDENDTEMTFSTTAPNKRSSLSLNVSRANRMLDRTIVNFGGNTQLPKFQLRSTSTKVYIPVEGSDYAIVSAEGMGEMPVNFKAEKSGSYTISAKGEEVDFTYLHLIDNMTGADVDLLANPTYSFNAQTTDYASRFRLVFATDSSVNSDSFGFVNNSGNFCVYGIEGEATLQVYDVLGHMLSSETFSGSIEKKVNAATGVYMMRLINGNDVKVQKVIIK